MRVAVFGDVHGNILALEKFINATRGNVDAYLCLGDIVNYGPWNDECLEMIFQLPEIRSVQGNHERIFLAAHDIAAESELVQAFFEHCYLNFRRHDLISELPLSISLGNFECRHMIEGRIDRNYLVGHTHRQSQQQHGEFMLINPGSVGQNRQWINMVDFAIINAEAGGIEFRSVAYDVDAFISELRARRYPRQCIEYYANKARQPL